MGKENRGERMGEGRMGEGGWARGRWIRGRWVVEDQGEFMGEGKWGRKDWEGRMGEGGSRISPVHSENENGKCSINVCFRSLSRQIQEFLSQTL